MAAAGEVMNANRHLAVPDVINDPHSAWHSVLLADALEKVGVKSACRIGPQVGQDVQADHAAILDFLRRTWNRRSEGQAPAAGAGKVPKSVTAPGKSHQTGGTPARITLEAQAGAMNVLARVPILDNQVFALGIPETIFRNG